MNKNLFCFWTDKNPMSPNRANNLKNLKDKTGFDVVLITPSNLKDFIIKDDPLPKEYEYLSAVHRSDYLRCYFMHYYGGGYSDIKKPTDSWIHSFEKLNSNDNLWISGYKEVGPGGVAHNDYREFWKSLIGNGCYICKPKTPLTYEWYNELRSKIDSLSESLQKFPATHPRDKKEDYQDKNTCYPIEWNEILGRIFHPLIYKYRDHIDNSLPQLIFSNYQ